MEEALLRGGGGAAERWRRRCGEVEEVLLRGKVEEAMAAHADGAAVFNATKLLHRSI